MNYEKWRNALVFQSTALLAIIGGCEQLSESHPVLDDMESDTITSVIEVANSRIPALLDSVATTLKVVDDLYGAAISDAKMLNSTADTSGSQTRNDNHKELWIPGKPLP